MFYNFRQNNSGGSFTIDEKVSINVIVEATNAAEANSIAESIGIYFDGCHKGWDCNCCGDRWSEAWSSEGTEDPTIYGEPYAVESEFSAGWNRGGEFPSVYVYYKDGRVEKSEW